MKFSVPSQVLKGEVEVVGGVVSPHPAMPILENFLLYGEGGKLHIVASDGHTEIRSTTNVELEEEGRMVVPAKIFGDTLKKLPEQPLNLYAEKTSYDTHVNCKTGNYKIASVNPEDFPISSRPKEGCLSLAVDVETLLSAIDSTLYATSKDELRPAMMGLLLRVQEQCITLVSTDGHRLVECTIPHKKKQDAQDVIVPRVAMEQLKKVLAKSNVEEVHLSLDTDHIVFGMESKEIVSKLIDDKFPTYKNVIPSEEDNKNVLEIERMTFLNALERSDIYANRATSQIKLSLRPSNKLSLTAEDLDFSNKLEETLDCSYTGPPIEIGFNGRFLSDTLRHIKSEQVLMRLKTGNTGAILQNPEEKEGGVKNIHLIMPIMLD